MGVERAAGTGPGTPAVAASANRDSLLLAPDHPAAARILEILAA